MDYKTSLVKSRFRIDVLDKRTKNFNVRNDIIRSDTNRSLYRLPNERSYPMATYGIYSENTSNTIFKVYVITNSTTINVSGNISNANILVVGGGGGGGETIGGGGGGGEVLYATGVNISSGSYSVSVGAGGDGGETGVTSGVTYPGGDSGGTSSFDTYVASGGGGGGGYNSNGIGTGGGNGGGEGAGGGDGVAAGSGQNAGGTSGGNTDSGAGGGGAGAVGSNSTSGFPGAGGIGSDLSAHFGTLFGEDGYFGGGGGGGARDPSGGNGASGGSGGGGKGGTGAESGTNGIINTGGGGGGGGYRNSPVFQGPGGSGGSGIVIISYPKDQGDLITGHDSSYSLTNGVSGIGYTDNTSDEFTEISADPIPLSKELLMFDKKIDSEKPIKNTVSDVDLSEGSGSGETPSSPTSNQRWTLL